MTDLRRGVLAVVGLATAGLWCELLLQEHVGEPVRLVPFAASLLVAIACLVSHQWPGRASRRLASWASVLAVAAAAFGCWEHLEHNFGFEAEIHPSLPFAAQATAALFGAGPVLAPAVLALFGALLWIATRRD